MEFLSLSPRGKPSIIEILVEAGLKPTVIQELTRLYGRLPSYIHGEVFRELIMEYKYQATHQTYSHPPYPLPA